jgi:hypothetical protein
MNAPPIPATPAATETPKPARRDLTAYRVVRLDTEPPRPQDRFDAFVAEPELRRAIRRDLKLGQTTDNVPVDDLDDDAPDHGSANLRPVRRPLDLDEADAELFAELEWISERREITEIWRGVAVAWLGAARTIRAADEATGGRASWEPGSDAEWVSRLMADEGLNAAEAAYCVTALHERRGRLAEDFHSDVRAVAPEGRPLAVRNVPTRRYNGVGRRAVVGEELRERREAVELSVLGLAREVASILPGWKSPAIRGQLQRAEEGPNPSLPVDVFDAVSAVLMSLEARANAYASI